MSGMFFEDLAIGQSASISKTISEADLIGFAAITGDTNPVHLDEEFAKATPFGGRIAHGMLSAALISAVFGTRLPGPGAIYVAQSLKFKAPVRIGATVNAEVVVTGLVQERKFVTFRTICSVDGRIVLEGEATLMVPSRDQPSAAGR